MNNICIGLNSGIYLTTGTNNIFIGKDSGLNITTESLNLEINVDNINIKTKITEIEYNTIREILLRSNLFD